MMREKAEQANETRPVREELEEGGEAGKGEAGGIQDVLESKGGEGSLPDYGGD